MPADRDRGQPPAGDSRRDPRLDPRLGRRARLAQASQPVLQRLTGVPTFIVASLVGVGVLAALIVDNRWAVLGVLPALALLGWLSYLAWPHLAPSQRVLRVGVLVGLVVWAASRVLR